MDITRIDTYNDERFSRTVLIQHGAYLISDDPYEIEIIREGMTDVKILDEKAKPMKKVPELANGLNLPKHMAEHVFMFNGPSVTVKLRTSTGTMTQLVDWFGKDFKILEKDDGSMIVRLTCNERAMRFWALQYGPYVEVLEPESLRNQLKEDISGMYERYMRQ